MKKILTILTVIGNIIILGIAVRWYSADNKFEPAIVIIGQILSLTTIFFSNSGNVTLSNFNKTKFSGKHEGSGNFKADGMDDSEVDFNK